MSKIILLAGKAESGKTTTAHILKDFITDQTNLKTVILAYGDYVKSTAKLIFGWNGNKDEEGRKLLQKWGTDIVRKKSPNFWVETVKRLVDVAKDEVDIFIIEDCRFPNELDVWNEYNPLKIYINRPGHISILTPEQKNHPSETSLNDYIFDVVLNATDIHQLESEIRKKVLYKVI